MATLTLLIGTLSGSRTATDLNAQRVLESVYAQNNDNDQATNQEKLDFVVQVVIPKLLQAEALKYEEYQAVHDAREAVNADPPEFD